MVPMSMPAMNHKHTESRHVIKALCVFTVGNAPTSQYTIQFTWVLYPQESVIVMVGIRELGHSPVSTEYSSTQAPAPVPGEGYHNR